MTRDPIVEEVRATKERLAAQFAHDVKAILADARRKQAAHGQFLVRLKPKKRVA